MFPDRRVDETALKERPFVDPLVRKFLASEKIDAFLPVLDQMMGSGLITVEKVQVLQYGDGKSKS